MLPLKTKICVVVVLFIFNLFFCTLAQDLKSAGAQRSGWG